MMANLNTSYMGMKLKNPIIVSSSGLTKSVSKIKQCEEKGAGAVILKSLFEEQFIVQVGSGTDAHHMNPEALDYLRSGGLIEYGPHEMCRMIEEVKNSVEIPVIASINCQSPKLWPRFAEQIQGAGADALELNIYFLPIDLDSPGTDYEDFHLNILREVKNIIDIPVAVKMTPEVTSLPFLSKKLSDAGCDALVFFNWFLEPDIDVRSLKSRSIKGKGNFHHTLRWVGLLAGRIGCDISSSGGIRDAKDVIKILLAGASAVQVCTLFYEKGLEEIGQLCKDLQAWMEEHRYASIADFQGELSFKKQELSFRDLREASAYFRAQYLKVYGD
jgi:dihydroorotate dehydrogenase (fumarate)